MNKAYKSLIDTPIITTTPEKPAAVAAVEGPFSEFSLLNEKLFKMTGFMLSGAKSAKLSPMGQVEAVRKVLEELETATEQGGTEIVDKADPFGDVALEIWRVVVYRACRTALTSVD